ncbi:hypothetical protein [Streptomyces sp. NPDC002328]|uniref:hypothetical protein n=1 Tax=Streptomyces sp. NPDC002328 TaxID=3364642 RepID=UPI0036A06C77
MPSTSTAARTTSRGDAVRRYAAGAWVNLLIGVPTAAAVACARWYAAHGHCGGVDDTAALELGGCTYDQIENSPFAVLGLVLSGGLAALLVLLFDVLGPRSRRHSLAPRLLTLPVIFLPYALLTAAAR